MNPDFEMIDALKADWEALQPLSPENEQRLWKKLRLEWNYHSNHIEGNTLTYGETELLLLHDQTHGNHTLREYEEMKAHDVGIAHLLTLAKDKSRLIGESDIRDLNKLILKEPFWKPAQTADGKASRKQIIPGDYKISPNNVLTATGEMFEFAPPTEVPARMERLVKWLDASLSEAALHPVIIAAKLHHDFVLIHPFDDGNGRVARMLVNYLFLRLGYPPIIVPTQEKTAYLTALRLADAGNLDALTNYIGGRLEYSLLLGIKAGSGERVEELGDAEKEIALLIQSQEHHKEKVRPRSQKAIQEIYDVGLSRLIAGLEEKMQKFTPLFITNNLRFEPRQPGKDQTANQAFEQFLIAGLENRNSFQMQFHLNGFRGEATSPFNLQKSFTIHFEAYEYTLTVDNRLRARKLYSEPVLSDEVDRIIEDFLRGTLESIKKQSTAK